MKNTLRLEISGINALHLAASYIAVWQQSLEYQIHFTDDH